MELCAICYEELEIFYGFTKCLSYHCFCSDCFYEICNGKWYNNIYCPIDRRKIDQFSTNFNGTTEILNDPNVPLLHIELRKEKRTFFNNILQNMTKFYKYCRQYFNLFDYFMNNYNLRKFAFRSFLNEYSHNDLLEEDLENKLENIINKLRKFNSLHHCYVKDIGCIVGVIEFNIKLKQNRFLLDNYFVSPKIIAISKVYFEKDEYLNLFSCLKGNNQLRKCIICFRNIEFEKFVTFSNCQHKFCASCITKFNEKTVVCPIDFIRSKIVGVNLFKKVSESTILNEIDQLKKEILDYYKTENDFLRMSSNEKVNFYKKILSLRNTITETDLDFIMRCDEKFLKEMENKLELFSQKYLQYLSKNNQLADKYKNIMKLLFGCHYQHRLLEMFRLELLGFNGSVDIWSKLDMFHKIQNILF